MIKIPKFFHELLGEYQTKSSLVVIGVFVLISSFLMAVLGYDQWKELLFIKQLVTWLLFLDISGGVLANLTKGTDLYYNDNHWRRWVFIAIHVQPIILSWAMDISLHYGMIIYVYTLVCAIFLNLIRNYHFHSLTAGGLTSLGLLIVAYFGQTVPFFALTLFTFYVFKVLFSFSVFHHRSKSCTH
ncbi:hypothetical protein [Amphibacillus cookii]|uniref:hypothetical protein n=1 Tax=Amphibacillus cookii TaxID=767787 RepID=UPI00195BAB17|nr:hypothetical protein [Amphibacillus cookii]MBM7541945.1 hypothetical protein [Amphibacillus cookii]